MVLQCTTCHDPHGNDNYRNLRPDPTKSGLAAVSIVTVQAARANGTNPAQVYVQSNMIYKSGVSKWCEQCHGTPTHHSVDKSFSDYSIWIGTTLPRVPVLSPLDNTIPSTDDQVICTSCHKSHGSENDHLLIYAEDGAYRVRGPLLVSGFWFLVSRARKERRLQIDPSRRPVPAVP
jgi:predicted CXXCH cytochrome family protein